MRKLGLSVITWKGRVFAVIRSDAEKGKAVVKVSAKSDDGTEIVRILQVDIFKSFF